MERTAIAGNQTRGVFGHTYAEPLSGLRVSWGAVLAGTVALLSTAILLWALAFAIVMLATHPTGASIKGSVIALWICAICTTLIGAVVGGWLSGFLPGNPRRIIGATHGFISWGVALILASVFSFSMIGNGTLAATRATVQTLGAAVETVGSAAGGQAASGEPLDARARRALVSLGYTPDQAARMVGQAQTNTQQALGPNSNSGEIARQKATGVAKSTGAAVIDFGIGAGWTWFGTWLVSMALAMAAGASGAGRSRYGMGGEAEAELEQSGVPPVAPVEPAPAVE
jgi:hypothetical protein